MTGDVTRGKITEAKRKLLPLPELMKVYGHGDRAKKSARCPFPGHEDKHPSFSVFKAQNGSWLWKCHVCGEKAGDEIAYIAKLEGLSLPKAASRYLELAGFPVPGPELKSPKSLCVCVSASPISPISPMSPMSPTSPMSLCVCESMHPMPEGQGLADKLNKLGVLHACTAKSSAEKRSFGLAVDLARLQHNTLHRKLTDDEIAKAFDEWHRLSLAFLDPDKAREDYWFALLAEIEKVRVLEGDALNRKALEALRDIPTSELPEVPGYPEAPESMRRILGLCREMHRLNGGTFYLSWRDAAKAVPSMTNQKAGDILHLLVRRYKAIRLVKPGTQGKNGKAAYYEYLPQHIEAPSK